MEKNSADMVKKSSNVSWLKRAQTQKIIFISLVVGPAFAGYLLFTLYPNVLSIYYSFLNWDGVSKPKFAGLFNFTEMIKDKFMYNALYHNLILILVIVTSILILSILISDLLIMKAFKENSFYKVLFFLPNVLSAVVIALMWAFIYDGQNGLLNSLLKLVGLDVGNFYWLGNQKTALLASAIPQIWCGVGFYVLIFSNAMRAIPKSLYESAIMDGITDIKRLFMITLPLISGVIRVAVIFLVLGFIKEFGFILILTGGGPGGATDVIGLYMFSYVFGGTYAGGSNGSNYGYASAIGMMLFVILVCSKLIIDRFFKNEPVQF